MDDADQRLEDEDAILNSALLSEQRQNFNKAYEVHPFFRETTATVFSQSNISPEGWRSLSANDFEYDCSEMWHDFAHQTGASLGPLPPPPHIATPFVIYCWNRLGEKLLLRQVGVSLLGGKKVEDKIRPPPVIESGTMSQPFDVDAPSCAPVSDHARGRARPSVAQKESSPSPAPEPSTSALPASELRWNVVGRKQSKLSWAAIAAKPAQQTDKGKPAGILPITRDHALNSLITRPQLENLSKTTIIELFNGRFKMGPRIPCNASKDVAITMYIAQAQEPAPTTPNKPTSRPAQSTKTEFTLLLDPKALPPAGPQGDAASLMRQAQQLISLSGTRAPAELIGGRWSSQNHSNFILVFNGAPTMEVVASLRHIFAWVFGPITGLTPVRGYTRIILVKVQGP